MTIKWNLYGLLARSIVFIAFFTPVYQFVLTRETANTMNGIRATTSMQQQRQQPQQPQKQG
jgi:hypothetical protein